MDQMTLWNERYGTSDTGLVTGLPVRASRNASREQEEERSSSLHPFRKGMILWTYILTEYTGST